MSFDKKARAHRFGTGVNDNGRRQFINGDVRHGHFGFEFFDERLRFPLCLDLEHAQMSVLSTRAGFGHHLDQTRHRPPFRPLLLERFDLSIFDLQDRLDLQQFRQQLLRPANATALGEILQGVDQEVEPAARDLVI